MRMFPLSLVACCRQQVGGHKQVRQVVKPLSLRRAETERETGRDREREERGREVRSSGLHRMRAQIAAALLLLLPLLRLLLLFALPALTTSDSSACLLLPLLLLPVLPLPCVCALSLSLSHFLFLSPVAACCAPGCRFNLHAAFFLFLRSLSRGLPLSFFLLHSLYLSPCLHPSLFPLCILLSLAIYQSLCRAFI